MTDTLAQLIPKLQALLLDDGTLFSTATCTAAIRQALKDLNLAIPTHAADTMEAVAEQYEYELEQITALEIVDVLRQGTDTYADENISLDFDSYFEDDRPFFRLHIPEPNGKILIIRYTLPHTIAGLDSAGDSTLPALYNVILLDGAAWQACLIRATGTTEDNVLDKATSDNYREAAAHFKTAFETGLITAGRRKPPVGEPDTRAWNDEWHT